MQQLGSQGLTPCSTEKAGVDGGLCRPACPWGGVSFSPVPAASLHMQPGGLGRPRPLKVSTPAPPSGVWPHLQPSFSDPPSPPPPDPGQMHLPWRLEMLLLQALLDN